jgi:hypothetical protein
MKKMFGVFLAVVFVLAICFGSAHAFKYNGSNVNGKHWQFNIVGHPNSISGDNSNGRAIMVPLDTKKYNGNDQWELICPENTDAVFVDDNEPTYYEEPAGGVRLYFEASGDPNTFEIVDRDATDGEARIMIPSDLGANPMYDAAECAACDLLTGPEKKFCQDKYCSETQDVIAVNVYVRVLGKKNTCMNINGFAYDNYQQLFFWSGQIQLARKSGKATWVNVDDIFYVHWCDTVNTDCEAKDTYELSVFHDVFEYYFWDILNDGTRLVQVRLYPVTAQD